jgi:hypothetical protein
MINMQNELFTLDFQTKYFSSQSDAQSQSNGTHTPAVLSIKDTITTLQPESDLAQNISIFHL